MTRWSRTSALLGAVAWLGWLWARPADGGDVGTIAPALLLAVLLFTPLALALAATTDGAGGQPLPYRVATYLQPFAAALVVFSFLLPPGIPAGLLAAGWLLLTGLVGLFGLARVLARGIAPIEEACVDAGLLYLPVGGAWLVLSRLGAQPLGFGDTIVLLTAVHFHYAGFAAPILTGMAGRKLGEVKPGDRPAFRLVAVGVIAGTPLLAAGFTFSPLLAGVAACVLAASLVGLALLTLFFVVPAVEAAVPRALLIVSAASLAPAMLLAAAYAIGELTRVPVLTIPQMAHVHGWLNALGFVLCGLLAWSVLDPPPRPAAPLRRDGQAR